MGGVAPGWYPDYEASPGHQRYWDGVRWTERRRPDAPAATPLPATRWYARWVLAAVTVLVIISLAVLVLDDRETGSSHTSSPRPDSMPVPPAGQRTWEVAAAIDGTTFELINGTEVRLAGIARSCSTSVLARLLVGHTVELTGSGPDKDAHGRLLRYVDRDGVDIGKTMILQGWANASDEANPRRAIYRRMDARTPDICG